MARFVVALLLSLLMASPASAAPGDAVAGFGTNGVLGLDLAPTVSDGQAAAVRQVAGNTTIVASPYSYDRRAGVAVERRLSDGSLDATFGDGGRTRIVMPGSTVAIGITGVAATAAGKITIAGTAFVGSATAVALIRLNADGTPDNGFGTSGIALLTIAGLFQPQSAAGVVVDGSDNSAWVAARSNTTAGVVHVSAAGVPVSGNGFIAIDHPTGTGDDLKGIALAPDLNGVIAVGSTDLGVLPMNGGKHMIAVAIKNDGTLRAGFGTNGIKTFEFASADHEELFDVVYYPQQGANAMAAVGYANSDLGAPRCNQGAIVVFDGLTGAEDLDYEGDGKVLKLPPQGYSGLRFKRVGKYIFNQTAEHLIAAGAGDTPDDTRAVAAEFDAIGAPVAYGGVPGGGLETEAVGLSVSSTGAALMSGGVPPGPAIDATADVLLTRLAPGGQPDTGFAPGGMLRLDHGEAAGSELNAIAPAADGGTWATGTVARNGKPRPVILRRLADGTPAAGFGTGGVLVPAVPSLDGGRGSAIAATADGGAIVRVQHAASSAVEDGGLIKVSVTGVPDAGFGFVVEDSGETGQLALDSQDRIVSARADSGFMNGAVLRRTAAGAPDTSFDSDGTAPLAGAAAQPVTIGAIATGPDDRIAVVAGDPFADHVHVLRADGSYDPAFNGGAPLALDLSGLTVASATYVGFGADGRITVAGPTQIASWAATISAAGAVTQGPQVVSGSGLATAFVTIPSGRLMGAGAAVLSGTEAFRMSETIALDGDFNVDGRADVLAELVTAGITTAGGRLMLAGRDDRLSGPRAMLGALDDDRADVSVAFGTPEVTGTAVSFPVSVRNDGPQAAGGKRATLSVGDGLTITGVTGATCVPIGANRSCTVSRLAGGADQDLTVETTASRTGTVSATAAVSGGTFDANAANDSASADATVQPAPTATPTASPSATPTATATPTPTPERGTVKLAISKKALKQLRKKRRAKIRITLSEPADLTLRIKLSGGKLRKAKKLKAIAFKDLDAGTTTVTLRLTRAGQKAMKRAGAIRLALSGRDRGGHNMTDINVKKI